MATNRRCMAVPGYASRPSGGNRFSLNVPRIHPILRRNGNASPSKERMKMANGFDPRATASPQTPASVGVGRDSVAIHAGLRSHMLSVYNYMASGVLLTGIIALSLAASGVAEDLFLRGGILKWVVLFAPLIMVFFLMARVRHMSLGGLQLFFWSFAAMMGLSMSVIPLLYSGTSIATTFFATSAAFVSLSLW